MGHRRHPNHPSLDEALRACKESGAGPTEEIGGLSRLQLGEWLLELQHLRTFVGQGYRVVGIWPDGDEQPDLIPDRVALINEAGESWGDGLALDFVPLCNEVLRRQAKKWCDSFADGEGPALEQLLALVPAKYVLRVDEGDQRPYEAGWEEWDEIVTAIGPTREAAIRAATCDLLGVDVLGDDPHQAAQERVLRAAELVTEAVGAGAITGSALARPEAWDTLQELVDAVAAWRAGNAPEPRRCCGTCLYWVREGESVAGDARLCRLAPQLPARTAESSRDCTRWRKADTDPAPGSGDQYPLPGTEIGRGVEQGDQLPGVTVTGNVITSEGDEP